MGENPSPLGEDFSLIKCDAKGSRAPGFPPKADLRYAPTRIRVKKIIGNSFLALSLDGKAKNQGLVT
jgi:hypothetical protein